MHSKIWAEVYGYPVCTFLCVMIDIANESASFRDGTWQEIRGVDVKEGIYVVQSTQYLYGVHLFLSVDREVAR